jgi:hypothetical protein
MLTPGDDDFDDMHHALGRPDGAWVVPTRNYFVCAVAGPQAERFAVLGHYWQRGGLINGGSDAVFFVTPEGQRQLMAWLELRRRAKGERPFVVTCPGWSTKTIVAKSRSAAKYARFLDISDLWDGSYRDFLALKPRAVSA